MNLRFTSDEYLTFIADKEAQGRLRPDTTIEVTGAVTIPMSPKSDVSELPLFQTTFLKDFAAINSSLSSFNHKVKGNASFIVCKNIKDFGPDFEVEGNLSLDEIVPITGLNVSVPGKVSIKNCPNFSVLGPNFKVGTDLAIWNTALETLNIPIPGSLALGRNALLKELGPKVSVGKDLTIEASAISEVNIRIPGSATLKDGAIAKLGTKFKVGGYLLLKGTSLEVLDVQIGGDVDISDSPALRLLGPNFSVKGDLNIDKAGIEEVNTPVPGSAYLRGGSIKRLGSECKIGGSLYMISTGVEIVDIAIGEDAILFGNSALKTLGPNFKVDRNLRLDKTKMGVIDAAVPGHLDLSHCEDFTTFGPNFKIGGDVDLEGTAVTRLDQSFPGTVYLKYLSKPVTIGPNFNCSHLDSEGTKLILEELAPVIDGTEVETDILLG